MKHILLLGICLFHLPAFAQNGFFVQPYVGAGFSSSNHTAGSSHITSGDWAFTYNGGANAGYQSGRWVFTAGLEYLRMGENDVVTQLDALGAPIGHINDYVFYHQLAVPLAAGYRFNFNKKLSFTPFLGAGVVYNFSASETDFATGKLEKMPSSIFDNDINSLGEFCTLSAQFEYKLSPQLSVTLAPQFLYVFSNMFSAGNNGGGYTTVLHPYELMANAGLKWSFVKRATHPVSR